ncbi:pyrimidine-nucleoside phosphorylase [Calorimonas adulescens]|jgi:pyrimidine-nucleoside phosphorylase|uniref:Pyrimidine-nucleoside phosphorylase n=1 Tax=Calorimonas adulescens TaxID=2606906 RepID=A0A5D8QBR5_9THEO|nr:pyrimidine-nucleoside phosphorylase [Calorimonas adulescens]TZE81236.1 pyrimidine-nucleoside phosphorylase [Calorimonas adulescens]
MRMVDLIKKKRDGMKLSRKEIEYIIQGYVSGDIPDYQMSALTMAIYFRGMDDAETANLTMAMANSGEIADLSPIKGIKVDKHSTGGVADTTTLVLAPLVAACGAPVAKMSGRGLGHTGGTLDKLESIPGMKVSLTMEEFIENVNRIGLAVIGQTEDLAPADKKLYALRDVTATVDIIPLIASSIMSKKLAGGSDAIVLDVKLGDGAFMKDYESALKLAQVMVSIGENAGKRTVAVITDMNQPLGLAIGNSLEVIEACEALQGRGCRDLMDVCMFLGSHMLMLAGVAKTMEEAASRLEYALEKGMGFEKFKEMVRAQGGNPDALEDYSLLPTARIRYDIRAENDLYISKLYAEKLGLCAMRLGAGRERKEDVIDLSVGIMLNKKVGDFVKKGEVIATVHANDEERLNNVLPDILNSIETSDERVEKPKLIYAVVTKDGITSL